MYGTKLEVVPKSTWGGGSKLVDQLSELYQIYLGGVFQVGGPTSEFSRIPISQRVMDEMGGLLVAVSRYGGGQQPRFSLPSIPCLGGDKVRFQFELQVGGSTFGVVPNPLGGGVPSWCPTLRCCTKSTWGGVPNLQ